MNNEQALERLEETLDQWQMIFKEIKSRCDDCYKGNPYKEPSVYLADDIMELIDYYKVLEDR